METVIKLILSLIFGYAGLVKIIDTQGMRDAIEAYRVVDGYISWTLAYFIPALEIVLAVALWVKPLAKVAAFVVMVLSLFFTALIGSAWLRGLDIECGCFGKALQADSYMQVVVRDVALAIISAYLWRRLARQERV